MFNLVSLVTLLTLASAPAWSAITPTSPDSNTVVTVGQDIKALWAVDTTGTWKDVEIQLMTGDNLQMIPLATLATGIDGTTSTGLNMPCPDVTPYSKIYFLQFTLGGDVSTSTWTTRFTITGADGSIVPPSNSTNYNGNQVEWGTGALAGAAPTIITGTGSSSSNSTSGATTPSAMASAAPMASASMSADMPASSASDVVVAAASTSASASMASMASASSMGASRASAAPSVSASGAALRKSTVGLGAVVLGFAGIVAL